MTPPIPMYGGAADATRMVAQRARALQFTADHDKLVGQSPAADVVAEMIQSAAGDLQRTLGLCLESLDRRRTTDTDIPLAVRLPATGVLDVLWRLRAAIAPIADEVEAYEPPELISGPRKTIAEVDTLPDDLICAIFVLSCEPRRVEMDVSYYLDVDLRGCEPGGPWYVLLGEDGGPIGCGRAERCGGETIWVPENCEYWRTDNEE
jgi:hypothetical protein